MGTDAGTRTSTQVDHEIVIVGAGFSGIGVAIKLEEAGLHDYLIIEAGSGVGGTWYWNTYPGIAVDIPSFSYQYSFEKHSDWSRVYAPGNELRQYAEGCVDKYKIRNHIRFDTKVTEASYDDADDLWRLTTGAGDEITARFILNCSGVLTTPKSPDIPGVDDFEGVTLHTARWDHTQDLRGKRVAVIGTGASAVQLIPELAEEVEHLTVFQRTPVWCLPKFDTALPDAFRNVLTRIPGSKATARLISQTYVEITFPLTAHYYQRIPIAKAFQRLALRYLAQQVPDREIRAKLTPHYGLGCKRPTFHNTYYATYSKPNVYLETTPIREITSNAVVTSDGAAHEIDVLVTATGFKVMESDNMPTYHLVGSGGAPLEKFWDENRMQAYEGVSIPGFPNYFSIMGPYGYNGSSYFALIEHQTRHIMRCLKRARQDGARRVEVKPEANDRYFAEMLAKRGSQIFWHNNCSGANSYYFNKDGDVPLRPGPTLKSIWRSYRFDLDDYEFTAS